MNNITIPFFKYGLIKSLPLIQQSEVAECGLACIAMISGYYGNNISMSELRSFYSTSLKGMSLQQVVDILEELNFSTKIVKLQVNELLHLTTPCILHWDLDHFVVLKKANYKYIVIHDPSLGEKKLLIKDVSNHFTGYALEAIPNKGFIKKKKRKSINFWDIVRNIQGVKKYFLNIFLLSVAIQLFSIITPIYTQLVIDDVVSSQDFNFLKILVIVFIFVVFINSIVNIFRSFAIMHIGAQIIFQLSSNIFRHLLKLPISFFEKRHLGDIVSRFSSIDSIKEMISKDLTLALIDGFMVMGTLIMMFLYSVKLSFVALVIIFILILIKLYLVNPLKNISEEQLIANADEDSHFMETVRAIQAIKLMNAESIRKNTWHRLFSKTLNVQIKFDKVKFLSETINIFLIGIESIIVFYFAAYEIIEDKISIGMVFAFMVFKTNFTLSIVSFIEKIVRFKMLEVHLDRVSDIIFSEKENNNKYIKKHTDLNISGKIELKNINFCYNEYDKLIINNFNLSVLPKESIAITGASGSGKTTLVKIMLGLLKPTSGEILIDDINVNEFGLLEYRKQVSAVMQNDQLLSGTIADNISFFSEKNDKNLIEFAAKTSLIHDEIMSMPMSYNTLIGDMGTTLSGGQYQRILLARALYKKPKILYLDESTSNLDTALEKKINDNIKSLGITRIIIAHRPDTIKSAKRIINLDSVNNSV